MRAGYCTAWLTRLPPLMLIVAVLLFVGSGALVASSVSQDKTQPNATTGVARWAESQWSRIERANGWSANRAGAGKHGVISTYLPLAVAAVTVSVFASVVVRLTVVLIQMRRDPAVQTEIARACGHELRVHYRSPSNQDAPKFDGVAETTLPREESDEASATAV